MEYGSHPARGAWIEIPIKSATIMVRKLSHPARGAWIEIAVDAVVRKFRTVAPRKGCVD